jgi:16S rRNA (guanine966-N2)-methyltransferase
MRIIAGEFRGRTLLSPESDATRPITDRAKQSLFDILQPVIPDAVVFDCFAGTGSMGLECLSRGARAAWFFEQDRSALQRLRENIASLKVEDRSTVIGQDLFKWFERTGGSEQADLVFLDPPYRFLKEKPDALRHLAARLAGEYLNQSATVIFRHDAADELELAPLERYDQRRYGSMLIELFRANHE